MAAEVSGPIEQVLLGLIFDQPYSCMEHSLGLLPYAGDALGSDCTIGGNIGNGKDWFVKQYRTDGSTNEDWYGWRANVRAPVSGTVIGTTSNPTPNKPGVLGRPPPGECRSARTTASS